MERVAQGPGAIFRPATLPDHGVARNSGTLTPWDQPGMAGEKA